MLIDINVRELSQFIEIMDLKFKYDGFGTGAQSDLDDTPH